MALTAEQNAYVRGVTDTMDAVANAISSGDQQQQIYTDRLYGPAGAREITDADLTAAGYDFDANMLALGVTLYQQLLNFRDNQPVVQGDYGTTMNTLRSLS